MKLREFKDKEELINETLEREDLNEDFSFYEILTPKGSIQLEKELKLD